jgi:peptide/nickel transport system permease protein
MKRLSEEPGQSAPNTPSGGRIFLRRLMSRPLVLAGLSILLLFYLSAWLAPLIANNKPLYIRYEKRCYFPAFNDLFPLDLMTRPGPVALRLRLDPAWLLRKDGKHKRRIHAILPPVPYAPDQVDLAHVSSPPSAVDKHYLGCDGDGRDVLSRLLHGAGATLGASLAAMVVASFLGIVVGGLAGYAGGWLDTLVIGRLLEAALCFPTFFLIVTVVAAAGPEDLGVSTVALVIGLTSWPGIARYIRSEVMKVKEAGFVRAAVSMGVTRRRIFFRHILPHALPPALVSIAFGLSGAILAEAALSFLGIGIRPPAPSWGGVLASVRHAWRLWWLGVFPGAAIFAAVLSYNLIGEGIREALNPHSERRP